ncbi:Conserved phage C-terminus (Phg_2220_C) [Algoriella xinjiangensis]|uniref:conserved phage C-terminal domain-containing protein n=1 Tax=Algoriella xinjiangensis TaxID=684065 RepID=UPI000F63A2CF|nr:conserved phage C-terminal domain-containing protein [Algoriella xinjiangensis]VDH16134.1 Conserved phage C-terminus (Phg_2220_C) [Algoriella xinjiangensis]
MDEREKEVICKLASLELVSLGIIELKSLILQARKLIKKPIQNREAIIILEYLNKVSKRDYKKSKLNLAYISARLKEGISVEELKNYVNEQILQINQQATKDELHPVHLFSKKTIKNYLKENP